MPLIWTRYDGRVTRTHNQPETLSDDQRDHDFFVDSVPDAGKDETLYYSEKDGFWTV